jgi:hypothetical protein
VSTVDPVERHGFVHFANLQLCLFKVKPKILLVVALLVVDLNIVDLLVHQSTHRVKVEIHIK